MKFRKSTAAAEADYCGRQEMLLVEPGGPAAPRSGGYIHISYVYIHIYIYIYIHIYIYIYRERERENVDR